MDDLSSSFDISYIEKMSAGDKDTQKQLLKILISELQNDLPRAVQLLNDNDWEGLTRFCHHFKSTIAFSGNKKIINANLQLWDIAKKKGKVADAQRALKSMNQESKKIERHVKSLLRKM